MWPNPLQYFLVPDIDVGENGMEGDSGDEEEVDDSVVSFIARCEIKLNVLASGCR